jgi:hypothetical protein
MLTFALPAGSSMVETLVENQGVCFIIESLVLSQLEPATASSLINCAHQIRR